MTTKRTSASNIHDESSESSSDLELHEPPKKTSALAGCSDQSTNSSSSSSSRMQSYKDNLAYDPRWKNKYPWMDNNSTLKGMVCL